MHHSQRKLIPHTQNDFKGSNILCILYAIWKLQSPTSIITGTNAVVHFTPVLIIIYCIQKPKCGKIINDNSIQDTVIYIAPSNG